MKTNSHDVQAALYVRYFICQCEVYFPNLPVSATGHGTFKLQHARLHLSQLLSHFLSLAGPLRHLQHSWLLTWHLITCCVFSVTSSLFFHTSVNDELVLVKKYTRILVDVFIPSPTTGTFAPIWQLNLRPCFPFFPWQHSSNGLPVCRDFVSGQCHREACRYAHVKDSELSFLC